MSTGWPTAIGLAPLAACQGTAAGARRIATTGGKPRRRGIYARLAALLTLVGASAFGALAHAPRCVPRSVHTVATRSPSATCAVSVMR